jgi:FkbM family methyltransferase
MNKSLSLLMLALGRSSMTPGVAVDIGAHEGKFSLALAESNLFEKVISFEASPSTYRTLAGNTKLENRIEAVNLALGETPGVHALFSNGISATASLLHYSAGDGDQETYSQEDVTVVRVDDYFSGDRGSDTIALIKIDTQGHDLAVLKGAVSTINRCRPVIQTELIFADLYQKQCSPALIRSFLEQLQYDFFSVGDIHISDEGRLAFCDGIFVPREMPIARTSDGYQCIDDVESYEQQIRTLQEVCDERLKLIERLSDHIHSKERPRTLIKRIFPWAR